MFSSLIATDNPILKRELIYQARTTSPWRRRETSVLVIAALIVFILCMAGDDDRAFLPPELLIVWAVQAATIFYVIIQSANALGREYHDQNWDSLVITGISARQIFWGKLRALVYDFRRWWVLLAVVRFIAAFIVTGKATVYGNDTWNASAFLISMGLVVLSIVFMIVLSGLEIVCCVALSLAANALVWQRALSTMVALTIRFAPVFIFAFAVAANWERPGGSSALYLQFGVADGGTVPAIVLLYGSRFNVQEQLDGLPGIIAAFGILGTLFTLSAVSALNLLRQQGAASQTR